MTLLYLLLVLFLIGFGIWAFYRALRAALQTFLNFYSWIPPKVKEVSSIDHPLPIKLYDNAQLLVKLGFQPVGVSHTKLFLSGEGNTWHYIDSTGEIVAELGLYRDMVAFTTWFHDNALIQTYNPIGENIQTHNFHTRFTTHSVETAYHYHTEQVEIWRWLHNKPVKFTSVIDTLPYEAVYRSLYRIRHMRRLTITMLAITLIWLGMAISTFATSYMYLIGFAFNRVLVAAIVMGVFVIGGFWVLDVLNKSLVTPPNALDS
jgi:hypothetical protein